MGGRLWSIRLCVALLASLPLGCASGGAKSAVAQPPVPPAQPEVQKADPALAVIAQAEAHLKAGLAAADEGEMDAARANWHFHSYSRVKHGFTNPAKVEGNPAVAYNASADRQSWAAMLSLFDEVLGPASS